MGGKLIVFEGIDGSGKSTQTRLLKEHLEQKGHKVVKTSSPTKNTIGNYIRELLKSESAASNLLIQLLFTADRAEDIEANIVPSLEMGAIVLADRYMLSTPAYGGISFDAEHLKKINFTFPKPDLTIFLDASVENCIKRIENLGKKKEVFEVKEKMEKTRANYLGLLKECDNVLIVDGNKPINSVFNDIKKEVERIL